MKLIWFPAEIDKVAAMTETAIPACRLAVETAIVRHGTPLFLPDWSESWHGIVGVGVVIDRLGRHIDNKFASRYYSRFVIAVKAVPDDVRFLSQEYADPVFSHDGSILISKPVEPECFGQLNESLTLPGEKEIRQLFDKTVAAASRAFTLHTGDIVIASDISHVSLEPETRITISLGEDTILSHKIK